MTIKFAAPKDFRLPDGTEEGDEFKQLVTMVLKGKNLVVKSIGDMETPEEDKNEPNEEDDFQTAVTKQMR